MIEIKSRWDGSVLYTAENASDVRAAVEEARLHDADLHDADLRGADLRGADLHDADLRGADLHDADLRGADLRGANLRGANLYDADLRDADLRGADLYDANLYGAYLSRADLRGADLYDANLYGAYLRGADLRGAKGITPERCTDLLILLDQVGKIRAYKLTKPDGSGPTYPGLTYEVGKTVKAADANTDPDDHCGAGVNLATLPWCLSQWQPGYRIFVCEFTRADIAAIPTATDGKFRTHRCKVVREIPAEQIAEWLGLPPEGE